MFTRPVLEMATRTILLDVGGTFVKCSDGRQIPIDSDGPREVISASLREAVGDASDVAVAIPGPFNYEEGIFLMKHKFAAVYGERFADLIRGEGISFRFIHDVNAMLLGEMTAGTGKGYRRVALVTLGTGLGFSMSIDGEILKNEMGSPKVPIFNRPFRDGILEDYASKRGFLRGFPKGLTVKDLSLMPAAATRFAEVGAILAEALEPLLEEYEIECLLFGGQISRSFNLFGPSVIAGLNHLSLKHIGPISDFDNATFNGLISLQLKK